MDDLLKTLRAPAPYANYQISTPTLSIIRSVPSTLHSVVIGMVSCPTLTIYDNASGASGSILATFDAGATSHSYLIDLPALNGITAWVTQTGKIPAFNVITRT